MYSFIPTPDITASPLAFAIIAFVLLIICGALLVTDTKLWIKVLLVFSTGLAIFAAHQACFSTKQYANTPVVGELVGFANRTIDERCGKQTCTNTYHFVTYRVPEGNVVLRAGLGNVYPQQAMLYKN